MFSLDAEHLQILVTEIYSVTLGQAVAVSLSRKRGTCKVLTR